MMKKKVKTFDKRPDVVSKETRKMMSKENCYFVKSNSHRKYNKQVFMIQDHYNMFENLHFVRNYIQKKYNIDWRMLEYLLFLYAKQYFTYNDFASYPAPYHLKRIKDMIRKGHVEEFKSKNPKVKGSKNVYRLTQQSKIIVSSFYKLLSGEKPMPILGRENPVMYGAPKNGREQKMQDMMRVLSTPTETKFKIEATEADFYHGVPTGYEEEE